MVSHMFAFISLVFLLSACVPSYPKYNPAWGGGELDRQKAYQRQIGDRTFVVTYQGPQRLKGAQEYVLYRAGELTKSYGKNYFEVLYRDDWEFLYYDGHRRAGYRFIGFPGGGLVIRILDKPPLPISSESSNLVYEVEKLSENLAQANPGLAEYHNGRSTASKETERSPDDSFTRWRSVYDHYDAPSQWHQIMGENSDSASPKEHLYFMTRTGRSGEVIKAPMGKLEVAMWTVEWPSPFEFLLFCAAVAEREGFKAFKLENWAVEEHHANPSLSKMYASGHLWEYRIKAQIMFLPQSDPDSLGPVFEVDAVRSGLQSDASCGGIRAC